MFKTVALGLALSLSASFAYAKKDAGKELVEITHQWESDHLWKMGFQLGTGHSTDFFAANFESPGLWSQRAGDLLSYHGIFLDVQSLHVHNIIRDRDSFQLKDSRAVAFNLGLVSRTHLNTNVAMYSKLGANLLFVENTLTAKADHWGVWLALGFEHMWEFPNTRWNFFNVQKNAIFAEVAYDWNNFKADKVMGSPSLFNHVFLSLGAREFI